MAGDRTVKTTLIAEISQYIRSMREAAAATEGVGDSGKKSSEETSSAFSRLLETADQNNQAWTDIGSTLLTAGAATAAIGVAALATGVAYNTLRQTTEAALTSVLGSAEAAADQMDRLDEFATNSPFSRETFIKAQQQMLAFGIEAQKVVPYLDSIQNAVAATGGSNQEIAELSTIFAKIQGSAKITAEDLNEFGARGVNAAELIGSQMGKTGAQIRDEISAGSLDAQVALDALSAGMIENFDGAAEGVKNTFTGAVDRVRAAWRDFSADLAEPLVSAEGGGALVDLLNWAADLMRAFQALPDPIKNTAVAIVAVTTGITLLSGAFLTAVPRLAAFNASLTTMATSSRTGAVAVTALKIAAGATAAVLTAAAIGLTVWATKQAEAKARTEEYISTLGDLGQTTEATLQGINSALAEDQNDFLDNLFGDDPESLIDRAKKVGLAIEDLQGYILGESAAVEKVTAATVDYIDAQGQVRGHAEQRAAAGRLLTNALDAEAESLTEAQKQAGQKALADEAAGIATEGAADATGEYTDALLENIEAQREAAGIVLSLRDAQNSAEAAFDSARESVKENGKTLDVTTEKGRANRAALDEIASSGWDLIESMDANDATQKELQGTMKTTRDRFIAVAEKMGASSKEARELADELGLIPKNVNTDISADASQAKQEGREARAYLNSLHAEISVAAATGSAYAEANALYNYINGLNATIGVTAERHVSTGRGGQGGITFATGGAVSGPGTATSDSINARLSDGEHVWTASDVAKAGGQDAVYRLRAAVQAGDLQGFAQGGAVVKPRGFAAGGAVTGMYASAPSSRSYDLTFISRGVPSEREVRSAIVSAEALAIPGGEWA